jgi:hypothetical protein
MLEDVGWLLDRAAAYLRAEGRLADAKTLHEGALRHRVGGRAVMAECNGGGMIVESPGQVADLMTTVNLIRAVALPPRESMNLLMQIRSEIADD